MHDKILAALRSGAHAEALALARQAVADTPHDAEAHALLANAERLAGDSAAALHAMNRAVLLAPDNADMHLQRASFLLGERKTEEAVAALTRSTQLDPNQFAAYILQAQLALGRGEIDEADRQQKLAGRIAPDHPWVLTVESMVALHRGNGERALGLLMAALQQTPDDPQALYALGFAHLQQGQFAFAEQAFRRLLELSPQHHGLRGLLADVLLQQDRAVEAREILQPLLDDPEAATPGLKTMVAQLELGLGRPDAALPLLRDAVTAEPRELRAWTLAAELWRINGDAAEARSLLEDALAKHPEAGALWQLRLSFEAPQSDEALAVANRWLTIAPDSVNALEAAMVLHEMRGDEEARDALAQRIVEIEPGHISAESRIIGRLLLQDPPAAVDYVQGLMAKAETDGAKRMLSTWLGLAQDRAGRRDAAANTWDAANRADLPNTWPLTAPGPAGGEWPARAVPAPDAAPVAYLWGPPGSGVEKVAGVISFAGYPLRADRFTPQTPQDGFQNPSVIDALNTGALPPERLLAEWRAALPARGIADGIVIDWLPFWDNAFLKMIRPLQPEAIVLVALRDPRDMLLDWIAFGGGQPFGIPSPNEAALWIARQLQHVLALVQNGLVVHKLLRTDRAHDDVEAFASEVGGGLGLEQIVVPPEEVLGNRRFDAGHWREYAQVYAEPFALLSDVAQALGYPAD